MTIQTRVCFCASAMILVSTGAFAQMTETATLRAGDAHEHDAFGVTVSVSGDRIVVGAVGEDRVGYAGAAYIFERDGGGTWNQIARLAASDGEAGDDFGIVAISGDQIIVGAGWEDTRGEDAGAAYVFERDGSGGWTEVARLHASDGQAGDWFGMDVSITPDRAIVGAGFNDSEGTDAGAAYIFERNGSGTWLEAAKLVAGDPQAGAEFGMNVTISGDRAVASASQEDAGATATGAAYVFERDGAGSWNQVAKLVASDGEAFDQFGNVSLSADRLLVGAPFEDSGGTDAGAVYVFERDGAGLWIEVARLLASDHQPGDWFGNSVALADDRAVVGALFEDTGGSDAGAAYLFERNLAGVWTEVAKLRASDGQGGDWFGANLAVDSEWCVVGAPFHDAGGSNAGAAYVFGPIGTGFEDTHAVLPAGYSLSQNYPNPFHPTTTIQYALPQAADVTLSVYDLLGRQITKISSGFRLPGTHEVTLDASGLARGLYLYRLRAGDLVATKRMVVIR